jgi:hypothetical protein
VLTFIIDCIIRFLMAERGLIYANGKDEDAEVSLGSFGLNSVNCLYKVVLSYITNNNAIVP